VPPCEQGLGCDSLSAQCEGCASFRGLGFYPGHTGSSAKAISADGTVVVGSGSGPGTAQLPLRWVLSEAGPPQVLGTLVGGTGGFPEALSADGKVVVGWASTSDSYYNIFVWSLGGSPELERLDYGAAYGISADGAVVVGSVSITNEAFRWTRLNDFEGLGFLPGAQYSRAYAISADGTTVVGEAQRADTNIAAFRWTEGAGMEDLGMLPADTSSVAYATNADGSVVVGASGQRAFRWSRADRVMGELFAGWAFGTNALGSIVVGQEIVAGGERRVVIWDQTSQSVRAVSDILGDLIPSGWLLDTFGAVSASGKVVVGGGTNPASRNEAWVAVLGPRCPPPAGVDAETGTLLDAGL
jgi:probable HAF family extracellular repeat protein